MACKFIKKTNNFIAESKTDEILKDVGLIYLKDIKTASDAVKMMNTHNYDSVFFDFNKTIRLPSLTTPDQYTQDDNSGLLIFDSDIGLYVYNCDELFPYCADMITDIESVVPVKLKYNNNISNITADFKLYNFLTPYYSKSFNFYFDECPLENEELNFSMRCYILSDKVKNLFYRHNLIHTSSHIYNTLTCIMTEK